MAEVIWTSPALDDLDDLAEYIALSNTQAAKQLTQKVFDKISGLESHPESGKRPRELINLNYRELNVNPCRISIKWTVTRFIFYMSCGKNENFLDFFYRVKYG
jgi:toxin ParE1/3/4